MESEDDSVESHPQNPEYRNNLENFQPWGFRYTKG